MDEKAAQERVWRDLESTIERFGWAVQGVFPTEDSPGPFFSYTIGLHDKGLPELLVMGLPLQIGQRLCNDVATQLLERPAPAGPALGRHEHLNWPMPFYLLGSLPGRAEEFACAAFSRSGGHAKVVQVVWPDKHGRFPWESGVSQGYLDSQPFLCAAPA